jgi:hypothetical protein
MEAGFNASFNSKTKTNLMKRFPVLFLTAMGAVAFFSQITSAQDGSDAYQGYLIWEDAVYPSKVAEYEKFTRQQIELYAAQEFPHRVNIFNTTDFTYYWVISINNYADIDSLYMDFNTIYNHVPEQIDAINEGYAGTHESTRSWTCYSDGELSFIPVDQPQSREAFPYMFLGFCYPQKGKMDQARNAVNGFVKLAREKQAKMGWETYIGDLGVDAPMLFWASFAKDPLQFHTLNSADFDIMGERADELWRELSGVLRKYEEKTGWYRKDLSYDPGLE